LYRVSIVHGFEPANGTAPVQVVEEADNVEREFDKALSFMNVQRPEYFGSIQHAVVLDDSGEQQSGQSAFVMFAGDSRDALVDVKSHEGQIEEECYPLPREEE
jgi:hypothetical protein